MYFAKPQRLFVACFIASKSRAYGITGHIGRFDLSIWRLQGKIRYHRLIYYLVAGAEVPPNRKSRGVFIRHQVNTIKTEGSEV